MRRAALVAITAASLGGCVGRVDSSSSSSGDPAGATPGDTGGRPTMPLPGGRVDPTLPATARPPVGGLRALTRTEMANTLRDLLGDNGTALQRLPEETLDVKGFAFDNNRKANARVGLNNLRALELLYQDLVTAALADPKRRAVVVPCTPTGAMDAACMKQFVADFGLRALRRPLSATEQSTYEAFLDLAKDTNDFYAAAGAAARAILLNPEFVYRTEVGDPVGGDPSLAKLNGYEVATRMSYTLIGTTPDRPLLDDARTGKLDGSDGRRAAAARLLASPGARQRMNHFHAFWLGYQNAFIAAAANDPFLQETNTLIDDVVFDHKRDYKDVFLSKKTFLPPMLRGYYADVGAPASATGGWVDYPAADPSRPGGERAGVLSQGTFLSARKDGDETSVPRRGALVYARLACDPLPDPPPNVNVDLSGLQSTCVTGPKGFFAVTHAEPSCKACHQRLDPAGIGLERFNAAGKYRTTDTGKPQCTIDTSVAKLDTAGTSIPFDGPASLARALTDTGAIHACATRHAYRFMTGLMEDDGDQPVIDDLLKRFRASGDFAGVWLDMVSGQTFAMARLPQD